MDNFKQSNSSCPWCHGTGQYEAVEWPDGLISVPPDGAPPDWPGPSFLRICDHGAALDEQERRGREEDVARRAEQDDAKRQATVGEITALPAPQLKLPI